LANRGKPNRLRRESCKSHRTAANDRPGRWELHNRSTAGWSRFVRVLDDPRTLIRCRSGCGGEENSVGLRARTRQDVETSGQRFPLLNGMTAKRRRRRSKSTFSCGHPRTPENTRVARGRGYTWGKCRICDNRYMRDYMRRRARERLQRRLAELSRAEAELKQILAEQAKASSASGKASPTSRKASSTAGEASPGRDQA